MFYWNDKISYDRDNTICELSRRELTLDDLYKMLDKITIFREIRILNALKYRLSANSKSILYKIRKDDE